MSQYVEISFDCLPLRSVGRLDIPIDASPKYRQRCERIKAALAQHGSHNSFYLYNAACKLHLTNSEEVGMLDFRFEGTVLTDVDDLKTVAAHLTVTVERETCDWLTEPIVEWFRETVHRAVMVEFDRYISAGDLKQAIQRAAEMQAEIERSGGYVGMGL